MPKLFRNTSLVLLLPACLVLAACGGADRGAATLRVMSYSVEDGQVFAAQVEAINSQLPDLVALQQVDLVTAQSLELGGLEEIAAAAGMSHYLLARPDEGQPALVILSRYPFTSSGVESLPVSGGKDPLIALWAGVDVPGIGPVLFVNTRLESFSSQEDRIDQVDRLNQLFANSSRAPNGEPMPETVLLAGDFGADSGNPAIDRLEAEFTDGAGQPNRHSMATAVPRNAFKTVYRLSSASSRKSQSWLIEALEDPALVRSPLGCSVIAHRGASAYLPEHTSAAYGLAFEQHADFLEPDLVMTKDGVPVVRHESQLSLTTDIADDAEFAARKSTRIASSGAEVEDWYSEDFNYAEVATLGSIERYPVERPGSAAFDSVYPVLTLQQAIDLWQQARAGGNDIMLYPEIKVTPGYEPDGVDSLQVVMDTLAQNGLSGADDNVLFQSFDAPTLLRAAELTDLPLAQYMAGRTPEEIDEFIDAGGLDTIAAYAAGVGVNHAYVWTKPPKDSGEERQLTRFVESAHAAGLFVHVFTFRAENRWLPVDYRIENQSLGDFSGWLRLFFEAGVDGVIVDQPDIARAACDQWLDDDHRPVVIDFEF